MYLGIDIGTSAVKAVVANAEGAVVAEASAPLAISRPRPMWSEQDPDWWWQATQAACAALNAQNASALAGVSAIGLSGQMHGAVCLDADHRVIRPAILWNDGRSHAECEAMLAAFPQIAYQAGVPPMPGFTAPKIKWMRRHEPELHNRIRHVVLPKDYVRLQLTGDIATDMADAAGTLWLDEKARKWSPELAAVSDTELSWLPELFEGTQASGSLSASAADALGLPAGIPVAAGAGDAAAGAVGIGAVGDGEAFVSLGTSGQIFVATRDYRPAPETMVHAFAHGVPARWFQMGVMLNGASPLAWFAGMAGVPVPDLLAECGDSEPSGEIPLLLPYLSGERSPHNDPYIKGAFYGLDGNTDRAAMTRAVLEGVAYSFCDAQQVLSEAGTSIAAVAAVGGGARSDLWLQTIADVLNIPVSRGRDAEKGPAFGAARLAQIAAGDGEVEEVCRMPQIERTFEPRPGRSARHAARFVRFRALYTALKPIARMQE